MPTPGMLSPYRVLDLTDGRAELATFILAGLGAEVIKIEPAGGSPSRRDEPLDPAQPLELASLRFHAYNRGKHSVVLDLDTDRERFLDLVATADFVFENAPPGAMNERGLGFDALRAVRPDLVYVAVSPFGQTGPYAHHVATDLTLSAMGGTMAINGEADRRPVRITVPQTWLHASAEATVGALVAHERRLQTGEAQFVDVSVQASVFWTGLNAMLAHPIQGTNIERMGTFLQLSTVTAPIVYPCADGEVVLILTGGTLPKLVPWLLEDGAVTAAWAEAEDWATYEVRMLRGQPLTYSPDEIRAVVRRFAARHAKAHLFHEGLARSITIAPVNTTADVLALDQLSARDFWDNLTLPSGRSVRTAGPFAKSARTPISWPTNAPTIGQHTADIVAAVPQRRSNPQHALRPAPRRALEGVKFADFSWIGVGPITAKAFADHGATVVHIETAAPADRLRMVGPFKDGVAGVNRSQFFGSMNTSKLSIHLDLKHPEGKAIALKLLAWADIALDSFTAGTMAGLGLGYEIAKAVNPDIIMATTCLLGQYGPAAQLAGYGYHAAAISGFYEVTGWDDRAPGGPFNAYTDTIAPRFLTTTLLAALDHRRRTGEGQFIEQAQMESALHFLAPELLDTQVSGRIARRAGNVSPTAFPHDAFPCAGDDQWCAIAIETDDQWRGLCAAMGNPAWADSPGLATTDGRRAAADLIDRELSSFTSNHESRELMDMLQAVGIPAGMVQRSSDHQLDPQLAHRGFFHRLEHPEMGEVPYEGHQYQIASYEHGPHRPAPCLGEHTYEILSEILGLDDDQVAEVLASGACG